MPTVQPADLWRESGRWEHYGKELLRFKDRHERDYCLGPTHEEVVTDLIRGEVRSYRQLPMNLYQIQTKFRDEIRPRFGLMRGREFLMKDAYSFDRDDAGAGHQLQEDVRGLQKDFQPHGAAVPSVEADSGSIGGNFSHEFMVLAETGEDTIAYCTGCDWSANIERAAVLPPAKVCEETCAAIEEVTTPDQHTIEEVCGFLKVPAQKLIKTLLYVVDGKPGRGPRARRPRAERNQTEELLQGRRSGPRLSRAGDPVDQRPGGLRGSRGLHRRPHRRRP